MIGQVAALNAILGGERRAMWLVQQRSLTDELDREPDGWRALGLKVERLSGEHILDAQRLREADLWVATTEKFEAAWPAASPRRGRGSWRCTARLRRGAAELTPDVPVPDHGSGSDAGPDAAVFTWRGDYRATGWLAADNSAEAG